MKNRRNQIISVLEDENLKDIARKTYETAKTKGIKMVCRESEAFPERLRHIFLPPLMLYYYGELPKENIPLDMAKFADADLDLDVFPVSARKGRNVKHLKEFLVKQMPEGEKVFMEDIVSDKSEKFMISEMQMIVFLVLQ